MGQWQWYGAGLAEALKGGIDWDDGNVKLALMTSSYAVNLDTHDFFNDITNEVVGAGYTAGGGVLDTFAVTYVADSSATAWQASTAYQVGDVVRPTAANGHVYKCITAGTSHTVEPTFPTGVNDQVLETGGVEWVEYGLGYIKIDADDETWANSTITARFAAIYYSTGTSTTSPLLLYNDFGSDQISSNGNFTVQFDPTGIATIGTR